MKTRADRAINWIEDFCVTPSGVDKGKYVKLSLAEKATVAQVYAGDGVNAEEPVSDALAAYLALLHTCGPEALGYGPLPNLQTDPWSLWAGCGPRLLAVVRREADTVTCPELRTSWPRRAA